MSRHMLIAALAAIAFLAARPGLAADAKQMEDNKKSVAAFYDANIGPNQLTVTREETFPSSSPTEIAYILVLRTEFPNGFVATVRGAFTYKVNDSGLITNLRGYWNMDAMQFTEPDKKD